MMGFRRFNLVVVFGLLLLLCPGPPLPSAVANEDRDYQLLELFTDVLSILRRSYVEEVDTTKLIHGAIRGMLATLDPHSSFLDAEMFQEMKDDTHGEFGGLGIEVTIKDGLLVIVTPIEDTPAFKAGLKAGDQILKIGDSPTKDMDILEAVKLLRGPKGEPITIMIWREEFENPQSFTIVRDIIQLQSVKSRLLSDGYGYIRLAQFQERSSADLRTHLDALRQANGAPLKGLILDLRNNPGGLLDQAVAVSDLFLASGLIVYTEGREAGSKLQFNAQLEGTEPDYPLVVLINGGSASAAEIVAGALHDQGRAVILGEQSFGKGSVQTVIPLGDDSGLRLTTARYFTPAGISIQARGITPDILVPQLNLEPENNGPRLREKDLAHHFRPLQNQQLPAEEEKDSRPLSAEDAADYQLLRAFDLLRGVEILGQRRQSAN
jgi:carboxyl-terminal processing protease